MRLIFGEVLQFSNKNLGDKKRLKFTAKLLYLKIFKPVGIMTKTSFPLKDALMADSCKGRKFVNLKFSYSNFNCFDTNTANDTLTKGLNYLLKVSK